MAKYDPLTRYLRRQAAAEVVLTFAEIETLLNAILPKRAWQAEWWTHARSPGAGNVQTDAWLRAGYQAMPSVERERVTFRKFEKGATAKSLETASENRR